MLWRRIRRRPDAARLRRCHRGPASRRLPQERARTDRCTYAGIWRGRQKLSHLRRPGAHLDAPGAHHVSLRHARLGRYGAHGGRGQDIRQRQPGDFRILGRARAGPDAATVRRRCTVDVHPRMERMGRWLPSRAGCAPREELSRGAAHCGATPADPSPGAPVLEGDERVGSGPPRLRGGAGRALGSAGEGPRTDAARLRRDARVQPRALRGRGARFGGRRTLARTRPSTTVSRSPAGKSSR